MDKETKGSSSIGRRSFSAEFRAEAVRLVTSGERSQAEVARNLEGYRRSTSGVVRRRLKTGYQLAAWRQQRSKS